MKRRTFVAGMLATTVVASCSSKFPRYRGPKVTQINVHKSQRVMQFFHKKKLLKSYKFNLGFSPVGHKQFEGDGKTPEGRYFIDRKNPNSSFYLSLGISYPNAKDRAFAKANGKSPGGDIFIHGTTRKYRGRKDDWTWGCISVTDREMREIYSMIEVGTPIILVA